MERLLEMVIEPSEPEIDERKLKQFLITVKVWDYVGISFADYQKLSLDDCSYIVKNYYRDMESRFGSGSGNYFFIISLFHYLFLAFSLFFIIFEAFKFFFSVFKKYLVFNSNNHLFSKLFMNFFNLASAQIDSATSSVIRNANLVTLIKTSADKNYTTQLIAEKIDANKNGETEIAWKQVWKETEFSGDIKTDCNMVKVNFLENSFIYINQAYLTVQKNKKTYYCNFFYFVTDH